ncbi:hypothetical protein DFH27DRAFT_561623 [Peziza echinospora]|nr:hypothetical protein DFH27DRAFT_561623 [Peziza echinospora]
MSEFLKLSIFLSFFLSSFFSLDLFWRDRFIDRASLAFLFISLVVLLFLFLFFASAFEFLNFFGSRFAILY